MARMSKDPAPPACVIVLPEPQRARRCHSPPRIVDRPVSRRCVVARSAALIEVARLPVWPGARASADSETMRRPIAAAKSEHLTRPHCGRSCSKYDLANPFMQAQMQHDDTSQLLRQLYARQSVTVRAYV